MSRLSQLNHRIAAAGRLTVSQGLTMLAGLVLLLIAAGTTQHLLHLRKAVLADADRQLTRLDLVLAEQTGRAVETVDFMLRDAIETLSARHLATAGPAAAPSDVGAIEATLRRHTEGLRQLLAIALTDAQGNVILSSRPEATADLGEASHRAAAFHATHPQTGLRISEPLRLPDKSWPDKSWPDKSWTVLLTRRISAPDGSFEGIAAALLNLAYFQDFFRTVEFGDKDAIVLHHRDGTVLTRYPAADAAIGTSFAELSPFTQVLSKAPFGSIMMTSPIDGSLRLVTIRALRTFPLAISISADVDQMLAGWRRQALFLVLGAVTAGLSIGGLLLLLARRSRDNERLVVEYQSAKEEAEHANMGLREQMAERERAEAALNQAHRIEAIGQLTGGVAHDFNNLLTIVLGNIDLLERSLPPDDRARARLAAMRIAAERGARLTGQLLAFARRQPLVPRAIDINAAIAGMDALLRSALASTIRLEKRLDPALWPAMVDPTQIELVILNLAINARDAMPAGGTLTIETANVTITAPTGQASPATGEPGPGEYVAIAVRDTGQGMTQEVLARAFEPFFTTKPPGVGSGLGLPQVLGTAQQSGGGVRIESVREIGTTVRIYLPRAGADAMTPPAAAALGAPASEGHATVLIVDDDAAVRRTVAELLTGLGYGVRVAESGAEALERLRTDLGIDVLLTDVVMPVMNGPALAREALRMRPSLPVVFMSGYANPHEITGEGTLKRLLRKPFRPGQLAEQLNAALER